MHLIFHLIFLLNHFLIDAKVSKKDALVTK